MQVCQSEEIMQQHFFMKRELHKQMNQKAEIGYNGKTDFDTRSYQKPCVLTKEIVIDYCNPTVVNKKRQIDMLSKGKFLVKINNLKKSGKMHKLMNATSEWIDANQNLLYNNVLHNSKKLKNRDSKKKVMQQLTERSKMMGGQKGMTSDEFSIHYEKQEMKTWMLDNIQDSLLKKSCQSRIKSNAHI